MLISNISFNQSAQSAQNYKARPHSQIMCFGNAGKAVGTPITKPGIWGKLKTLLVKVLVKHKRSQDERKINTIFNRLRRGELVIAEKKLGNVKGDI